MIRNVILRLLACVALIAVAVLCLPALSRPPAAEEEKPLGKVSSDLALVPRDALWFVSVRPADLMKHPGLKALKEAREVVPAFAMLEKYIRVTPDGIERLTAVARRAEIEHARIARNACDRRHAPPTERPDRPPFQARELS